MDDKLGAMIAALSPVMNPAQAEGFLHVAAFTRRKWTDSLSADDWPALEGMVREALLRIADPEVTEDVCEELQQALLAESTGAAN